MWVSIGMLDKYCRHSSTKCAFTQIGYLVLPTFSFHHSKVQIPVKIATSEYLIYKYNREHLLKYIY